MCFRVYTCCYQEALSQTIFVESVNTNKYHKHIFVEIDKYLQKIVKIGNHFSKPIYTTLAYEKRQVHKAREKELAILACILVLFVVSMISPVLRASFKTL